MRSYITFLSWAGWGEGDVVKVRMKGGTRGGADPENKEGHCASS